MESLPELGELAEVNAHVAVLVGGVDKSLGLSVGHLPAHLADEGDQLLGGDHAVTVSIEEFERMVATIKTNTHCKIFGHHSRFKFISSSADLNLSTIVIHLYATI